MSNPMQTNTHDVTAMVIGSSFAAGLNVYATVATLGLLARAGWLELPDPLHALESWWVIAACGVLFGIEFVADKIPAFDLFWNALQTFVRIPVAALIAYKAATPLSPGMQAAGAVVAALIALAAHGSKTALRAAVTPSPEPFSNSALSLTEDAGAIGLTWLATQHPYVAATITAVLVALAVLMIRWVVRGMKRLFGARRERMQAGMAA